MAWRISLPRGPRCDQLGMALIVIAVLILYLISIKVIPVLTAHR